MWNRFQMWFKVTPKKDVIRDYEKDVLSSLQDVLPSYYLRVEEPVITKKEELVAKSSPGLGMMEFTPMQDLNNSDSQQDSGEGGYCEFSVDLFSLHNRIRQLCIKAIESNWFMISHLIFTLVYMFILIVQPYNGTNSGTAFVLSYTLCTTFDIMGDVIYLIHTIISIIALGIWNARNAFYRSPINGVNGIGQILGLCVRKHQFYILRVLYLSDFVTRSKYFVISQRISQTLKQTGVTIIYVLIIIFSVMSIYAAIGLQIWNGAMDMNCLDDNGVVDSFPVRQCGQYPDLGRQCDINYTCQHAYNQQPFYQDFQNYTTFESLPKAYLSMIIIHYIDGYPDLAQKMTDTFSQLIASVFTWTYLIFSTFFLQNLIVAVLLSHYQQHTLREEPQSQVLPLPSKLQHAFDRRKSLFFHAGKMTNSKQRVLMLRTYQTPKTEQKSILKRISESILKSNITSYCFSLLILANLIIFSLNDSNANANELDSKLAAVNLVFISFYLLEDLLRFYVWKRKDNKFTMFLELTIDIVSLALQIRYYKTPIVLNSLKGFRLLWFFNTQTNWSNYSVLLSALSKSIATIPNILLILTTTIIVLTVLGRSFFAGELTFNSQGIYDINGDEIPRLNFDALRQSITSIFTLIALDQWEYILYTTANTGDYISYPFFIISMMATRFLMLPCFLTLMLDNYQEAKNDAEKQKAFVENTLKKMKGKTKATVVPLIAVNSQVVTAEKPKRYFGRTFEYSEESEEESDKEVAHGSAFGNTGSKTYQHTIFQRSGSRMMTNTRKQKQEETFVFNNNQRIWDHCKYSSLFILHQKSIIRRKITHLIQNKYYEYGLIIIIIGQLIMLAFDLPIKDPETDTIIDQFNILFAVLFTIDFLLKSLAWGFVSNQQDQTKAYIKNRWNALDLAILIITSVYDYQLASSHYLNAIKAVRTLRVLISLRRGQQNEELNLIASSLFQTISLLSSMLFVSGISIWILSIFGMNQWKGQLYNCSLIEPVTIQECLAQGGKWLEQDSNYDTILNSLLSLFKLIIGEGWSESLFTLSDITTPETNARLDASFYNQYFFYILLFLLNIMLLNLFVGLIINNYRTIKENIENYKSLNDYQKEWLQMSNIMLKKPLITLIERPKDDFRKLCYNIASYQYFEFIVIVFMLANFAFCVAHDSDLNDTTQQTFTGFNIIFIILFHVEILIKLMAFSTLYFKNSMNKLDLCLLVATDILLGTEYKFHSVNIAMIPLILRTIKVLHIEKFIKLNKNLKVLLDVVQQSVPRLISVVALVLITTLVYSLVGLQILSPIAFTTQDEVYPLYKEQSNFRTLSFDNFSNAFFLLIQISTGQYWPDYAHMYSESQIGCHSQTYAQVQEEGYKGCGTYFSYFFFISYLVLVRIIMFSLFVAMIIESYSDSLTENSAIINPYQIEDLLIKWSDYDPQGTGWITAEDFAFLMFELVPPMGFKDQNSQYFEYSKSKSQNKAHIFNHRKKMILYKKDIFLKLKNFNVPMYKNNRIHFKDVCIQIAHNAVCSRYNLVAIEHIEDKIVQRKIKKQWENKYMDLADQTWERKKQLLYAVDQFAISSISKILRNVIEKRKIKKRVQELQLQNKIQQLAMNEVSYYTKQTAEEGRHGRRKSQIKKRIFPFAQSQAHKPKKNFQGETTMIQNRKKASIDQTIKITTTQSQKFQNQNRKNSLQEQHNFYINPAEMNKGEHGFPMKVSFETQKIDFSETSNTSMIQKRNKEFDDIQINTIEENESARKIKDISERGSDEEDSDIFTDNK